LWVRIGAYPRVEHLKGISLGKAPALPTNTGLGWKGLPETNTLVYYGNPKITAIISFMIKAPSVIFATLHFLHNLEIGPISKSVCPWNAFLA
jgi:hypothetical protein